MNDNNNNNKIDSNSHSSDINPLTASLSSQQYLVI